jgi:recombination protein RecA
MKKKAGMLSQAAALAHEINSSLGTDVKLGDDPAFEIVRIPTGSLVLDRVTGGGFALGRHVELFGDENVGKSYIAYKTMALSQSRGKVCVIVDPEHSFDRKWFKHLGGKPKELLTFHPANADDAIAVMMLLAKHAEAKEVEVITIDSVASMVTREELEKDPREEDRIASQARMMSRALRRITAVNRQTLFIWVNQERMNIGVRFGNPKTTSGGRALRYYATTRIEMRRGTRIIEERQVARGGKLVKGKVQVGRWIQLRCEKDKSTRPFREGSFIFDNELSEISEPSEVIELGLLDGLIERKSNSFYYTDLDDKEWKGSYRQFSKWLRTEKVLRDELVLVIQDETVNDEIGGEDTG